MNSEQRIFKRIDILTILAGIILCPGVFIYGEYNMRHHGYGMHELITAFWSLCFLIGFIVVYLVNVKPPFRILFVAILVALTIYITFVVYFGFFDFQP